MQIFQNAIFIYQCSNQDLRVRIHARAWSWYFGRWGQLDTEWGWLTSVNLCEASTTFWIQLLIFIHLSTHLDQFWQVNSLLKWQRQECGVAWGGSRLHQMNQLVMDAEETGGFSHFLFASPPSSPPALLTFPLTSLWFLVLTFSLFLLYVLLSSPLNRAQSK